MQNYTIIYEIREHVWYAHVPFLPGCVVCGQTLEEAKQRIQEAIHCYLKTA